MESQNTLHPTRKIHLWILTLLFSISYISNGYCESHNANDWKSSYTSVTESAGVFIAQKRTTYCGIPKTYLVDRSGKRITPAFRDIGMFCNGLAEFVEAKNDADPYGMHGYLNNKGDIVIDPIYKSASMFSNGMGYRTD